MKEPVQQADSASQFPSVGRWSVTAFPRGWMYVADFGIKQMVEDRQAVAANVGLGYDRLESEDGLASYIEKQTKLIEGHLIETRFAGPSTTSFEGAEEAYLLFVRHSPVGKVNMLHVQTYVRLGLWLGIITLTTPEHLIKVVRPDYEAFVKGLRIRREEKQ